MQRALRQTTLTRRIKTVRYLLFLFTAISILVEPNGSLAQASTTWGLPVGAKARFGKGRIAAVQFSPDGSLLAVGSTVGLWLYDAHTGKEIALLRGSGGSSKIVFSPDGKLLASAGGGTIQLWDIATHSELHTLSNNITRGLGETMAFTANGETLISLGGRWEPQFQAWDVNSGNLRADVPARKRKAMPLRKDDGLSLSVSTDDKVEPAARVYFAQALSPDGSIFASAPNGIRVTNGVSDGEIRLTDVRTGEVIPTVIPLFDLDGIVFSPDGTTFAVIENHGLRLWEVSSSRELAAINLPTRRVNALAFSPDGRTFATANENVEVQLRQASTGKRILSFTQTGSENAHLHGTTDANALDFSPDGVTLAIATEHTVGIWGVRTGHRISTLAQHHLIELLLTDGQNFLSGDFQLRDIHTGQGQADLTVGLTAFGAQAEELGIWAIALSPDGTTLATGSKAGLLRLWNMRTGHVQSILTGHTGSVTALAFTGDNTLLASASKDGTIRLWEVNTGQLAATLTEHEIGVASEPQMSVSIEVLQPKAFGESHESELPQPIEESEDTEEEWNSLVEAFVNNIAFSPDGTMLASASSVGTIWLWEVDTTRLIATFTAQEAGMPKYASEFAKVGLAFSPDSTRLASSSWDGMIMISNLHTEQMPLFLQGRAGAEFAIKFTALAWAPDSTKLVSGSMDKSLQIWDAETGTELNTIRGHTGGITGLAFSQNGKTVASASWDGTILLWDWDKIK